MNRLKEFLRKIPLRRQRRGQADGGPLWSCLEAMSVLDLNGKPISPAGFELSELILQRGVSVVFHETGGEAAAPWCGLIIIEPEFSEPQHSFSSASVGIVAHELTHILQRDLNDPMYWPSGLPRINPHTRWFSDSTNYMEVQAYLMGWCVEYDLESNKLRTASLSPKKKKDLISKLERIQVHISTLASPDASNAVRYIVNKFPDMYFYTQNSRKEKRVADHRIPPGTWDYWLKRVGYSDDVVEHIRSIVNEDLAAKVNQKKFAEAASPTGICGMLDQSRSGDSFLIKRVLSEQLKKSFNANVGVLLALVTLYLVGSHFLSSVQLGTEGASSLVQNSWKWLLWLFIGVTLQSNYSSLRELIDRMKRSKELIYGAGCIVLALVLTTLCVLALIVTKTSIQFDLAVLGGGVDFGDLPGGFLQLIAFTTGYFYQVVTNFFINVACIFWEGLIGPLRELLGKG